MKIEDAMSKNLVVAYVPGTIRDALKTLTMDELYKYYEEQLALIMSNEPHLINKNQELLDAAQLLYKHRIHGLPVVDKRKNLVGILSPTDILKNLPDEYDDLVENYFTKNLVPVYQDTPITIIMEIINITNETALPVLDDDRKLVGIVSEGDLFKLSHIKESVSQTNIGMGGDEDEWTWEGIRDTVRLYYSTTQVDLPPVPVKEVMVTKFISASKNTPISEVARKMYKNNISHVPVVNSDNHLVGMVTDIDLIKCMWQTCTQEE